MKGLEGQPQWLPVGRLSIFAAFTFLDIELQDDYCAGCESDGSAWAPAGTELPISADFKGNLVARYDFSLAGFDAHMQGALAHEGKRNWDLRVTANQVRGEYQQLPALM